MSDDQGPSSNNINLTNAWTLLHRTVDQQLETARGLIRHTTAKGDMAESAWIKVLCDWLPTRYTVGSGFVVDSNDSSSLQIDILIYDRHFTPLVFPAGSDHVVVPAESVYAVLEAKQELSATNIAEAADKVESVRQLARHPGPLHTQKGLEEAKPIHRILGGIVAFDSDWAPPIGEVLSTNLKKQRAFRTLDFACAARHGTARLEAEPNGDEEPQYEISIGKTAVTRFLFQLIAGLQTLGSVPPVDYPRYAAYLPSDDSDEPLSGP